jgi:hypothetical protein
MKSKDIYSIGIVVTMINLGKMLIINGIAIFFKVGTVAATVRA